MYGLECKFKKGDIVKIAGLDGPKMVVTDEDRDPEKIIEKNDGKYELGNVYCMYFDTSLTLIELSFDVSLLEYATVQS